MVLILLAASPANAFGAFSPAKYRETLISQINYYRTHHGLPALVWNDDLQRAASRPHREHGAAPHAVAHLGVGRLVVDTDPMVRIRGGSWIGENLGVGLVKPYRMLQWWIASPPHRANLLCSHFRSAGIGVVMGTWAGRLAVYVTNDFGGP